jgi:hypothetical protein
MRHICRNHCLCPSILCLGAIFGTGKGGKSSLGEPKGTCDSLVATCDRDLGKRTGICLVSRAAL